MARAPSDAALIRAHSGTRRSLPHLEEPADGVAFAFEMGCGAHRAFDDDLQRTRDAGAPGLVAGFEVSDHGKSERRREAPWVE